MKSKMKRFHWSTTQSQADEIRTTADERGISDTELVRFCILLGLRALRAQDEGGGFYMKTVDDEMMKALLV